MATTRRMSLLEEKQMIRMAVLTSHAWHTAITEKEPVRCDALQQEGIHA